jgi:tetratricopeptide (TPR) repeat protein
VVRVFLSHSSKDKDPFVRELHDSLEKDGNIEAWLDAYDIPYGSNIPSSIAGGLGAADAVLLILSPDAVDSRWVEEEWTAKYWDQINTGRLQLGPVLYRDCDVPFLLRNKKRFDLRTNHPDGFRQIKAWLLGLKPPAPPPSNLPQRRLFVGRVAEIQELRRRLAPEGVTVAVPGMPGLGKTSLALAFAHEFHTDFETVYWLDCSGKTLAGIAAELERQIGLKFEGDLETLTADMRRYCAGRRCLIVLDNVEDDAPGILVPGGRASVLVTTRREHLAFLGLDPALGLHRFSDAECLDLFRRVLGDADVAKGEAQLKELSGKLGNLPIAIAVAAGLIKHDVRYTVGNFAREAPFRNLVFGRDNVPALFENAIAGLTAESRTLLRAMSACAPDGSRLRTAAGAAGMEERMAIEALRELYGRTLVEELDRSARRYRVHALVREAAAPDEVVRESHARVVAAEFEGWEKNWRECVEDLADLEHALSWALGRSDDLAWDLAYTGFRLAERTGMMALAYEFMVHVAKEAQLRGDRIRLSDAYGNQALILRAWGKLEEAMALYEEQQAICEELGDRARLSCSYCGQAIILQIGGKLEEAMALYKKEEAICEELDDRDGLLRSYGNQALILRAWGKLEDAMALHNKQEAICEELGDRAGLSCSYCGQAIILQIGGKLEEAMALHKKEEAICEDLGDLGGLARCRHNMSILCCELKPPDLAQARELVAFAFATYTSLNMPRETEKARKQLEGIDRLIAEAGCAGTDVTT